MLLNYFNCLLIKEPCESLPARRIPSSRGRHPLGGHESAKGPRKDRYEGKKVFKLAVVERQRTMICNSHAWNLI